MHEKIREFPVSLATSDVAILSLIALKTLSVISVSWVWVFAPLVIGWGLKVIGILIQAIHNRLVDKVNELEEE